LTTEISPKLGDCAAHVLEGCPSGFELALRTLHPGRELREPAHCRPECADHQQISSGGDHLHTPVSLGNEITQTQGFADQLSGPLIDPQSERYDAHALECHGERPE
jgi:hypothetical protein